MAAPELAGVPVLILREGASRSRGREAQRANIMAAKIVAESVRARSVHKHRNFLGELKNIQLRIRFSANLL